MEVLKEIVPGLTDVAVLSQSGRRSAGDILLEAVIRSGRRVDWASSDPDRPSRHYEIERASKPRFVAGKQRRRIIVAARTFA